MMHNNYLISYLKYIDKYFDCWSLYDWKYMKLEDDSGIKCKDHVYMPQI